MKTTHCRGYVERPLSRRAMLSRTACGFGAVALTALLGDHDWGRFANAADEPDSLNPFRPRPTHFPPRCKSVIYLYMDGAPSQVDTWDPKPLLTEQNGKPFAMKMEPTQFNNNGNTLGSPWKFSQHGESGTPVSELFPYIAKHVDELAVVRSMTSAFSGHTNANTSWCTLPNVHEKCRSGR